MKTHEASQIRLPTTVFNEVRAIALETGASQNSVLCILIGDGLRMRNAPITVQVKSQ